MIKNDLENLFKEDTGSFAHNDAGKNLLEAFDKTILEIFDENTVSQEVFEVYKKFLPMKNDAPENAKSKLFGTIRNFAKEQIVQQKYADALVLFRFLMVKSELLSQDYYVIAEILFKCEKAKLSKIFLDIYEKKELNKPLLFLTLGNFYNLISKEYKKAIKYYEKFLETDKTKPSVYIITANLYIKVYAEEGLKESIFYFNKALALKPDDRLILHGLAFGYEKLGDKENADKFYKKILENNPTNIDRYNYGLFLISCGEFEKGHDYLRYRFSIDDINNIYPAEKEKRWDLISDIKDKTLLVHYEQGFGDTIMYCRFVPQLKNFAKKIIFVVQDSLYNLIKNSPKISEGIEIISDKQDLSKIEYDFNMGLLDAPYVLKTKSDDIPLAQGYLEIGENDVKNYAKKYLKRSDNLKIAIACAGDKDSNYNIRDIEINKFNILTDIKGLDFYSLQYNQTPDNPKIIPLGNTFTNFVDSACAVKNMDLIITTDNVILNLAGALGVKTIGLFNKQTNYRWFKLNSGDIGWYASVKPLQAKKQNDWDEVFSEIVNILSNITI